MDPQQNQTPIQNPITTPIIPTEQIKPPHSHKIVWILLSVFILLVVAGLFVFKNQIKEKNEVSLVQNIATTTDEFAGWKMFKSDSLGLSFMYPTDYGEFMIDDQADALFGYFVDKNKNYSSEQYFSISAVTKDYNSIYQYFLDVVDFKEKNENQFILQRNYNDDIEVTSLKKYKLGDQLAIKVKNEDYDDEYNKNCQVDCRNVHGPNIIFIHLPMNAKYKVITFSDYDESKIDQILSTFKFLNTSTSTDMSNWKTYRNEEYGFEFKYPVSNSQYIRDIDVLSGSDLGDRLFSVAIGANDDGIYSEIAHFSISKNTGKDLLSDVDQERFKIINKNNIVVNGVQWTVVESEPKYAADYSFIVDALYKSKDLTYYLSTDDDKVKFKQILSTFKFTQTSTRFPLTENMYDEYAMCLKNKGAVLYGTFWSPHTDEQKSRLGSSYKYLPYVECSTPDAMGQTQICKDKKITVYPTWVFPDGSWLSGNYTTEQLGIKTGCELPYSVQ